MISTLLPIRNQLDRQLFLLSKGDLTGNGADELIVCTVDGMTYIVDHDKNVVAFQNEDPIAAFCAGPCQSPRLAGL
jgi:hypothetical protein